MALSQGGLVFLNGGRGARRTVKHGERGAEVLYWNLIASASTAHAPANPYASVPWWRVLKDGKAVTLSSRIPDAQMALLRREGIQMA